MDGKMFLNDLPRVDSSNFMLGQSMSARNADMYNLNMSFSIGRSLSRYALDRQQTNMSQRSVGGFKMNKDISITPNGDVVLLQPVNTAEQWFSGIFGGTASQIGNLNPIEKDFSDLDSIMFNTHSTNIGGGKKQMQQISESVNPIDGAQSVQGIPSSNNDMFSLPCHMTKSEEMDPSMKHAFKATMNRSIAPRADHSSEHNR